MHEIELPVPADLPADIRLSLVVGSPQQVERALGSPIGRRLRTAEDLESLILALGERRSAHRLTAVLFRTTPGVVSRGLLYDDLPPTAARLLTAGPQRPRLDRSLRIAPLATAEIELDGPIEGGLTVPIRVDPALQEEGSAP